MAKKKKVEETTVATIADSTTSLSTMGTNDVPAMLEAVTKQINSIKEGLPKQNKTTGELTGFGKIENLKTVDTLIKAASSVLGRQKAYAEAAEEIIPEGVKIPAFKINGSTAAAWISDIKSRVVLVANKERLDKLTKIQKTLESNLSVKDKLARDLQDIQEILNDAEEV